ncbi:putative quinol monooxygenase [Halomonas binhaiensis]|uniref:Antibiotic biosynthesis monooxygenase n=1 Tax=Halomonas binhaiensis TaxID=2562282 RepID=A0A5C1NE72_9GAMM|nr:putative quinol monooxygenase [Halomonas binhaiensis]QEM80505.1 antibiotic biosynthesis monooxygenase [Halomonas binhaiensis]
MNSSHAFVVIAEFEVSAANLEAFLAAAHEDATRSVADEPGCLQFDIHLQQDTEIPHVVFYEAYRSRDDFDTHLETPHLAAFRESLSLVERELPVRFLTRQ